MPGESVYHIQCECGYRNQAVGQSDAERYARRHEALSGHIEQTTVEERKQDRLVDLTAKGCSPAEALDYHMVEERGFGQSEWARHRGVTPQSVHENIDKAEKELSE